MGGRGAGLSCGRGGFADGGRSSKVDVVLKFEVEVFACCRLIGRVVISCPAAFHTDTDSTTRGDTGVGSVE